jgi:hypothetical protein
LYHFFDEISGYTRLWTLMRTDEKKMWLCYKCVGEAFLKARIENDGQEQKCSFCKGLCKAMPLDDIADAFEAVLAQYFYRTSDEPSGLEYTATKESDYEWERSGEPVVDVLQEIGSIEEEVAEAIRRILHARHDDYYSQEEGDFSESSQYSYCSVDTRRLSATWRTFTDDLKTRSRYFSETAATTLTDLFDSIHEYETKKGEKIIVKAGPGTAYASLYRARVFQRSEKLEEALKRPDLEIGPPLPKAASAGRMNARGISVFYGAPDCLVALAEVRPLVGSDVITARFDVIRPLLLLDIEALKSVEVPGSLFDPSYAIRLEKAEFLRSLSSRITMPVMPDDEPFEYLPTQAIADFLASQTKPSLDGIIYPSVQGIKGMKNVCLFHKAALIQEMSFPEGTEIKAQLETTTEDGPEIDYWVWEEIPKEQGEKSAIVTDDEDLLWTSPAQPKEEIREPTLRIVPESLEVHHITGITFAMDNYPVKRHRFERRNIKFTRHVQSPRQSSSEL